MCLSLLTYRSMKIQTELFLVAIALVHCSSLTFLIVSSYSNRGGMAMRVVRDTRGPSSEKVGRSHCGHALHWRRSRLPFHPQSKYSPQNNTHWRWLRPFLPYPSPRELRRLSAAAARFKNRVQERKSSWSSVSTSLTNTLRSLQKVL